MAVDMKVALGVEEFLSLERNKKRGPHLTVTITT